MRHWQVCGFYKNYYVLMLLNNNSLILIGTTAIHVNIAGLFVLYILRFSYLGMLSHKSLYPAVFRKRADIVSSVFFPTSTSKPSRERRDLFRCASSRRDISLPTETQLLQHRSWKGKGGRSKLKGQGWLTASRPEVMMRKAAGDWWPLAVELDGSLLHCKMSSYSDFPVWNS